MFRSSVLTTAIAITLTVAGCAAGRTEEPAADLVLTNGSVYTVNEDQPWAEAVAVLGKEIVYVGDAEGVQAHIGENTEVFDLAGKMLLPGFVESHLHPIAGMITSPGIDLQFDSEEEILGAIESWVLANPGESLVRGFGWRYSVFPPSGPRKEALDAIAPDRPVWLAAIDGHGGWVNSKAMELAGITKDTPDPQPPFSYFERDADGEPTGYLVEIPAMFAGLIPIEPITKEFITGTFEDFSPRFAAAGITAALDAGIIGIGTDQGFEIYQDLEERGELPIRIVGSYYYNDPEEDPLPLIKDLRERVNSELVQARILKINADGGDPQYTAAMLQPYGDKPDTAGELLIPRDRLIEIVVAADAAGIDTFCHCFGDRAVRTFLDAVETARAANPPRDRRHTVSHVIYTDPTDVPRFAELDVTAQFSIQWATPDATILGISAVRVGMDVFSQKFMVARSILDAGGRVAFGTDWPAAAYYSTFKPLEAIQVALTREMLRGEGLREVAPPEDEILTLEQALRAATLDSAYVLGLEGRIGSIEVGKLADLIVLGENLFDVEPRDIQDVPVLITMMNGKITHRGDI